MAASWNPMSASLIGNKPPRLIAERWCRTTVPEPEKIRFVWSIENFSCCRDNCLEYPTIFSEGLKYRWILKLYPRVGPRDAYVGISIDIKLFDSEYRSIFSTIVIKIAILNAKREEALATEWLSLGSMEKLIARNELFNKHYGLLPDDELTIVCEITVTRQPVNVSGIGNNLPQLNVPKCSLAEDFKGFFQDQRFSDVTLSVEGQEFQVHQLVLAARSKVFSAMFEHPMVEREKHCVEIHDLERGVVQEMLRFIYTGKVSHLGGMANKLLAAADKYQLERLKVMCEKSLWLGLSTENVVETLILADLHSATKLKAKAIEFISTNTAQVMETENFKAMEGDLSPSLKAEAFPAIGRPAQ